MINGVIFDMDGLMFDTERMWATFWKPALAAVVAVASNRRAFGKTGNLPGLPRPPLLGEVAKPIGFDGEV